MRHYKIVYVLVFLMIQYSFAQYQIKHSVVGNGAGRISSSGSSINSTVGQPAIGIKSNEAYNLYAGFWYSGRLYVPIADDPFQQLLQKFELFQNYPNPFNPLTTIRFSLPKAGLVKLEIYTLLGRRVTTLLDEHKNPGTHEVKFDGNLISSGIYVYRIQAGSFRAVKKMVFTK